jgi:putative ABC transport system substrate-binding protein
VTSHATRYVPRQDIEGANPRIFPGEQPTNFDLVINVKTTKQLGLTIPPNVLARADRVIK